MDFDDILLEIGDFGAYQQCVLVFILLPAVFPCGFHAYNQLFMAATPPHWCKHSDKSLENPLTKLDSDSINSSLETTSQCSNLFSNSSCNFGWEYNRTIYKNTIVTEWDLVCNWRFAPTVALVVFGIGGVIGNYIFGYVQDGVGRKPAFFIYLAIQSVFGLATALASDFLLWTLFRFGVGFTVPAILGTPYVLAVELVGPKHRTMVTVLINIAYSLALVTLAGIVYFVRSWRPLAIATTAPFLLFFFLWKLMPESPRWLMARGQYQKANRIIRSIAKFNGKPINKSAVILEKNNNNPMMIVKGGSYGVIDLFRSSNLRWKTIIITIIWFTNTSVYVGLSYYAPLLGGDEFLNFFLAGLVELPTYIFLWPAMESWGRRWTLCVSMVIGGAACLATFLVQNDAAVTLILYCIGKMGISSSFVVLPLMASELYPTVVRGLGMSFSSVVGMLGPVFIPLINYLGTDMLTLPLIIMGAMLILGAICSLLLPETLNQHLPQTLEDAEIVGLDCFTCCTPPQSRK